MYKVLLVDDEFLTRDAIAKNVEWTKSGFQLIGSAENGQKAVEMIQSDLPDLVLTDICMPVMDGIALSAYIHNNYPTICVVIISGYDEFEYAKQALKYDVSDYILKPITSYELMEELQKAYKRIDETREQQNQVEKIKWEYEKSMPTLRCNFLTRLLEGSYFKADMSQQLAHFHIQLKGENQTIVLIDVEDSFCYKMTYPDAEDDLIDFSIANIAGEITAGYSDVIFFQNTENKSILIFSSNDAKEMAKRIEMVGREIIEAIYHYLEVKICILVGNVVQGAADWNVSYNSAMQAGETRFLMEKNMFVYAKEVPTYIHTEENRSGKIHFQTSDWIEKIILLIKLNQIEQLRKASNDLFFELRSTGGKRTSIFLYIQNIVLTVLINLEDNTTDFGDKIEEAEFIHHLAEYKHLCEVQDLFLKFCYRMAENIAENRESVNQKQAVLALDYMGKNYKNINISLHMVCSYLCVSTSYFSTFFKEATGETFIEALTRIRMERAQKLLETTNMKSCEVAMEVGYSDPHYFSSIFKKRQGMTPTEYSKQIRTLAH